MFIHIRHLFKPGSPRRALGFLVGGLIVVAGSMLTAQPKGEEPEEAIPAAEGEAPELPRCANDEASERLYKLLRERHQEVRTRELALQRERKTLDERRQALAAEAEKLQAIRKTIDERIETFEEGSAKDRQERLAHLVRVVSQMGPARAGQVLMQNDRELAVELLSRLEPKMTADVLSTLPPEEAAGFTRELAARKRL